MKKILFVTIICVIIFGDLISQSKTMDFVPIFHKNNTEFTTSGIHYSPPIESTEFIGLSCYHFDHEDISIFYRLKTDNRWSSWLQFEQQREFVESNRTAYRTKPIEEAFSDIQFKTSEELKGKLTVRFFFATLDKNSQPSMTRSLNCDLPEACERDCWCPTCPIDDSPLFTEPTHLIVHHSAGNNQSDNFATVVEYIWDLHVNTNGWDDIGYNWLIDPNGILYEGRPDNFQGAHFSCINENTVGICVIGEYNLVQPSEAALSTLVEVLAFEATEHAIDVNDQSYHVTGDFILDNVAGHRDSSGSTHACSSTACPGDSFYPLLGAIRLQVSELACYDVSSATEAYNSQEIKVFPNPFDHYLFIKTDKPNLQSLEIIDLYGRSLGFVSSGRANDLSHLEAGVYFLVFEGKMMEKIVKR